MRATPSQTGPLEAFLHFTGAIKSGDEDLSQRRAASHRDFDYCEETLYKTIHYLVCSTGHTSTTQPGLLWTQTPRTVIELQLAARGQGARQEICLENIKSAPISHTSRPQDIQAFQPLAKTTASGLKHTDSSLPHLDLVHTFVPQARDNSTAMLSLALLPLFAALSYALPQETACATIVRQVIVPTKTATYSSTAVVTVYPTTAKNLGVFTLITTISDTTTLQTLTSTTTSCAASDTV